jgi:glycosyltransferase involved in cell wall biosynthesis
MTAPAPDYSIVIPCFNEESFLPATLASVREAMAGARLHRGEIVVTDNASTDATVEIARAAGAQVVFESHRQISRSRNTGARHARGRLLIFVDGDTRISGDLLRATLAAVDSGRACGGGARVTVDRVLPRGARAAIASWNWLSRRLRVAAGAYVYCVREAFVDVGGFPEAVYAGEELWLSRALRRWGRGRGMDFVILREEIVTSARKLEWYSGRELLRAGAALLAPRALRSREACRLWYERPSLPPASPRDRP